MFFCSIDAFVINCSKFANKFREKNSLQKICKTISRKIGILAML